MICRTKQIAAAVVLASLTIALWAVEKVAANRDGRPGVDRPWRIMAFGDSITTSCYPAWLSRKLAVAALGKVEFVGTQPAMDCDVKGFVGGHEGHACYHIHWVLQPAGTGNRTPCMGRNAYVGDGGDLKTWFSKASPDVVLWHIGTNDTWGGRRAELLLRAYSAVLDALRERNPSVVIVVAQILPNGQTKGTVEELNRAIPTWAAQNRTATSPIHVVDMHSGYDLAWMRDGVHPNDTGLRWMVDKWFDALVPVLKMAR